MNLRLKGKYQKYKNLIKDIITEGKTMYHYLSFNLGIPI